jgi:hypothetical protein
VLQVRRLPPIEQSVRDTTINWYPRFRTVVLQERHVASLIEIIVIFFFPRGIILRLNCRDMPCVKLENKAFLI